MNGKAYETYAKVLMEAVLRDGILVVPRACSVFDTSNLARAMVLDRACVTSSQDEGDVMRTAAALLLSATFYWQWGHALQEACGVGSCGAQEEHDISDLAEIMVALVINRYPRDIRRLRQAVDGLRDQRLAELSGVLASYDLAGGLQDLKPWTPEHARDVMHLLAYELVKSGPLRYRERRIWFAEDAVECVQNRLSLSAGAMDLTVEVYPGVTRGPGTWHYTILYNGNRVGGGLVFEDGLITGLDVSGSLKEGMAPTQAAGGDRGGK